jgi:hypothetical protein
MYLPNKTFVWGVTSQPLAIPTPPRIKWLLPCRHIHISCILIVVDTCMHSYMLRVIYIWAVAAIIIEYSLHNKHLIYVRGFGCLGHMHLRVSECARMYVGGRKVCLKGMMRLSMRIYIPIHVHTEGCVRVDQWLYFSSSLCALSVSVCWCRRSARSRRTAAPPLLHVHVPTLALSTVQ